ncbi:MAG: hypothetical protein ACRDS0_27925 [Pseudonocardiaceae bacterium]
MTFDTCPAHGRPARYLRRPASTIPTAAAQPTAPDGGLTAGPTAGVVVIDGQVTHRAALTVTKFRDPDGKDER